MMHALKQKLKKHRCRFDIRAVLGNRKVYGCDSSVMHQELGKSLYFDLPLSAINTHVDKFICISDKPINAKNFFLIGGDWQDQIISLEQDETYVDMKHLIIEGKPVDETILYRRYIEKIALGKPQVHGSRLLDNEEKVRKYCESHIDLYHSIKDNGYENKDYSNDQLETQIGVCIDANSKFHHFKTGHHRIAIAKFLEIPVVPVFLHFSHPSILQNCNSIESINTTLNDLLHKNLS